MAYYKKDYIEYYIKSIPISDGVYKEFQLDLREPVGLNKGAYNTFSVISLVRCEDTPADMDDYKEITEEVWNAAVARLSRQLKKKIKECQS